MDGKQFVDILTREFSLDIGAATKNQWRAKKEISPTIMRNAFRILEKRTALEAIVPLAEFHRLNMYHENNIDSFGKRVDNKALIGQLKGAIGIYAFFGSDGRLIYIGKTEKNNLFTEMQQRYWNKKVPFRVIKKGRSARFDSRIAHVCEYFSAYKINKNMITNMEALLTRIILNNASNLRVESFIGL